MIEVGNIVTLENNQDYLLVTDTKLEDKSYYYAVRVLEDETPTQDTEVFEALIQDGDEYLMIVPDGELKTQLNKIFADKLIEQVANMDENEILEDGE